MTKLNLFSPEIRDSGIILAYDITNNSQKADFEKFGSILESTDLSEKALRDEKGYGFIAINQQHIQVRKNDEGFYDINRLRLPENRHWYGIGIKNCRQFKEDWTESNFLDFASGIVERIDFEHVMDFNPENKGKKPIVCVNKVLAQFKLNWDLFIDNYNYIRIN